MGPHVRFFDNPAGQRVAYAVDGTGPPLVCVAWWVSHVEEDWAHPRFRQFFSALARRHTVVRYDRPGAGLSDREREVVDLESEVDTLEALVDRLRFDRVSLLGIACAGPPAIGYAARRPERVEKLVFFGSYVKGADVGSERAKGAMQALVQASWGLGARALTDLFAPDLDAEARRSLARAQRSAASPEMSSRLLALTFDMAVDELAPTVQHPALVVHRRDDRTIPHAAGRELAATLAEGAMVTLEGDAHLPWFGEVDEAAETVLSFLDGAAPGAAEEAAERFERQGSTWALRFDGQTVHMPDARGLHDLAELLARPGREVHAHTLYAGEEATTDGADPVLDAEAKAAYEQRLRAIAEKLREAEERQLARKADALRSERDHIARELRAAVGLGGRGRALGGSSERARKAVSARVRAVLGKIEAVHPALAEHLREHVRMGTFFSYDAANGPDWVL